MTKPVCSSFLVILLILLSIPKGFSGLQEPKWVDQPARTVDNGYIIYVSIGEDHDLGRALFKSTASGLLDVANECTFAPKGTRTEDHFQQANEDGTFTVFTKTGLPFEDCDLAQKAIDPNDIQRLANPQYAKDIQRYQEWLDQESNSPSASPVPSEDDPTATSSPLLAPNTMGAGGNQSQGPGFYSGPINTPEEFYSARQQVYYFKEVAILAPIGFYAASSPQTLNYIQTLRPAVAKIHAYERQNREVRNWSHSWSRFASQPIENQDQLAATSAKHSQNSEKKKPSSHPPGQKHQQSNQKSHHKPPQHRYHPHHPPEKKKNKKKKK